MSSEKITFYEQVLELEPESRLFFPLASLYFEENDLDKSRQILLKGLDKHPQHFEARLLLAAILNQQGQSEAADSIYQDIFILLRNNVDFWESLSRNLSQHGEKDLALAAAFFAGSCSGKALSWADIVQAGMESLQADAHPLSPDNDVRDFAEETIASDNDADITSKPEDSMEKQGNDQDQSMLQKHQNYPRDTHDNESISQVSTEMPEQQKSELTAEPDPGLMENYLKAKAILTGEKMKSHSPELMPDVDPSSPQAAPSKHESDALSSMQATDPEEAVPDLDWQDEKFEEPEELDDFNINNEARTRSMADLLFKQEEYAKALDIYQELLRKSTPGEGKEELKGIILRAEQAMNAGKIIGSEAEKHESKHKQEDAGTDRNGAINFLMALADRLEAKSV